MRNARLWYMWRQSTQTKIAIYIKLLVIINKHFTNESKFKQINLLVCKNLRRESLLNVAISDNGDDDSVVCQPWKWIEIMKLKRSYFYSSSHFRRSTIKQSINHRWGTSTHTQIVRSQSDWTHFQVRFLIFKLQRLIHPVLVTAED